MTHLPESDQVPLPPSHQRAGLVARLGGALLFYTVLPLPRRWVPSFDGIAALAPGVGALLGGGLALVDWALTRGAVTPPTGLTSALVVGLWLWLTGGLHLDGAMDTADGLAVTDPQQRLAVMADSRTGAFGVMVAIAILGLKTLALAALPQGRGWLLAIAPLWGRWGQVVAIARYPYLRAEGKGAMHRVTLRLPRDLGLGLLLGGLLGGLWIVAQPDQWAIALGSLGVGIIAAIAVPAWFQRRLGGHTGDTYGATVEWIETLILVLVALGWGWFS